MDIGILGTGRVAQTLGARWAKTGHAITYGSRAPASTGALDAPVVPSRAAVTDNEVVVNATPGAASLQLVEQIGADLFAGRIVVDVANATTPAFELVYPNSSLGERLQAALPEAKVVKTMNTAAMAVLSAPRSLPASSVFLSGEDPGAKSTVASLLADLGWSADTIVDLGGIVSARGTEHYFLLFAALMQSLGTAQFNIHLVR